MAQRCFTRALIRHSSSSKQKDLYEQTVRMLVDSVLEGFNGTVFAYGQTGTGKTFTMEGIRSQPELRGIIPSSFAHIFDAINQTSSRQFLVRASYLEIYNVRLASVCRTHHADSL